MNSKLMKRMVIAGVATAVIGFGGSLVDQQQAYAKVNLDVFDFQPHRGGRDARPENTLYSYAYAMEMGATSIECDMQFTKDGKIVMSHNPVLNHDITRDKNGNYVENGKYVISQMTVNEIKKFDVGVMDPKGEYYEGHGKTQVAQPGAQMPTLEELFQLIKEYGDDKVVVNAETKLCIDPEGGAAYTATKDVDPVAFVTEFNRLVKKYDMEDRVTLQTFDWRTIPIMKQINPNITTVALWCEQPSWGRDSVCLRAYEEGKSPWLGGLDIDDYQGNPYLAAKAIGADVVSPYYPEISQDDVALAHSLGMKVVPWTVNSREDMEMLLHMGVDGMISDKPWLLRTVLEEKGVELRDPVVNLKSKYHTGTNYNRVHTTKLAGGMDAAY